MLQVPVNVELQNKFYVTFIEPDPPTGFVWMYENTIYRVWPEKRGKNFYWYMRKMVNGERFNVYVAPAGKLTVELLNNAAVHIAAAASPVKPKVNEP